MSHNQSSNPVPPLFSQLEVSSAQTTHSIYQNEEPAELLREMLTAQDRTNELLEELLTNMNAAQKQRNQELKQWKDANPHLARSCRRAAEALSKVQIEYLNRMTDEITDSAEDLVDGEFVFNEFVDRFGPRLAHLNGVIQTLAQLAAVPGANSVD